MTRGPLTICNVTIVQINEVLLKRHGWITVPLGYSFTLHI